MKFATYLILAFALLSSDVIGEASASIITIDEMNADTDSNQLEGTLGGSGTDGSSAFTINSGPGDLPVASTSASYTVSGVDLDNNGVFDESFSFQITFSSSDNVNFESTLEDLGLGDEQIDEGESLTLNVAITSDSSTTHDVVFDGFNAFDFVSMSSQDSVLDVNGVDFEIQGQVTSLGQLFAAPTLTFEVAGAGGTFDSGQLEEWSLQFSTQAIPEPTSLATFSIALCVIGRRRRLVA